MSQDYSANAAAPARARAAQLLTDTPARVVFQRIAAIVALLVIEWVLSGLSGLVLAAFAWIPPRIWLTLVRGTGSLWIFAAAAAGLSWRFIAPLWSVWDAAEWRLPIHLTMGLTEAILKPLLPGLL